MIILCRLAKQRIILPVLDPRINYDAFLADCGSNRDLQDHVKTGLKTLRQYYAKHYAPDPSARRTTVPSHVTAAKSSASPRRNFLAHYGPAGIPENELEAYLRLSREDFETCDPVQWWASRKGQFPNLSRLARDILSIPGMSLA